MKREKKEYNLQVIAFNGEESRPVTGFGRGLACIEVCVRDDRQGR